ncbi:MAG: hypothetical protein LUD15_02575 [Bacteroides sp.]|nr:hypothetical protein [Bacteroides sp.]
MKKIILLPIVLLALLVSCTREAVVFRSTDEQTVELALRTSIRAGSGENTEAIRELELVVFKEGSFQYSRSAYASDYALFRSSLKIDRGVDIYFFANCSSILTPEILVEGTSWQEIRSRLILTRTHQREDNQSFLPMWGALEDVTISGHTLNQLTVTLLRAVAVADVYFEFDGVQNFNSAVTYLYYGADKAFIAPSDENLRYENGVLAGVNEPLFPQGMKTLLKSSANPISNQVVNALYMFDNPVEEGNNTGDPDNRRTRVVVRGYYQGSDKMSYYALDFFDDTLLPEQWLRATSNHRYVLKVTGVKSEG